MDFTEEKGGAVPLITAYGEGGFRVGERRLEGHLLISPEGAYPWAATSVDKISKNSIKPLFEKGFRPEFLIVGAGVAASDSIALSRRLSKALGIPVEVMGTAAAVRTYNVLVLEGRKVAAVLLAVE